MATAEGKETSLSTTTTATTITTATNTITPSSSQSIASNKSDRSNTAPLVPRSVGQTSSNDINHESRINSNRLVEELTKRQQQQSVPILSRVCRSYIEASNSNIKQIDATTSSRVRNRRLLSPQQVGVSNQANNNVINKQPVTTARNVIVDIRNQRNQASSPSLSLLPIAKHKIELTRSISNNEATPSSPNNNDESPNNGGKTEINQNVNDIGQSRQLEMVLSKRDQDNNNTDTTVAKTISNTSSISQPASSSPDHPSNQNFQGDQSKETSNQEKKKLRKSDQQQNIQHINFGQVVSFPASSSSSSELAPSSDDQESKIAPSGTSTAISIEDERSFHHKQTDRKPPRQHICLDIDSCEEQEVKFVRSSDRDQLSDSQQKQKHQQQQESQSYSSSSNIDEVTDDRGSKDIKEQIADTNVSPIKQDNQIKYAPPLKEVTSNNINSNNNNNYYNKSNSSNRNLRRPLLDNIKISNTNTYSSNSRLNRNNALSKSYSNINNYLSNSNNNNNFDNRQQHRLRQRHNSISSYHGYSNISNLFPSLPSSINNQHNQNNYIRSYQSAYGGSGQAASFLSSLSASKVNRVTNTSKSLLPSMAASTSPSAKSGQLNKRTTISSASISPATGLHRTNSNGSQSMTPSPISRYQSPTATTPTTTVSPPSNVAHRIDRPTTAYSSYPSPMTSRRILSRPLSATSMYKRSPSLSSIPGFDPACPVHGYYSNSNYNLASDDYYLHSNYYSQPTSKYYGVRHATPFGSLRSGLAPANEQLRKILGSQPHLKPVHLHPQWAISSPFVHLVSQSNIPYILHHT